MNASPVLELSQVSVRRANEDEVVLEDINWCVGTGEWWVLAGGHGSGKSLLLQSLAGLIPLAAGTLTVFGEPFTAAGRRASGWRPQIGLVFEAGGRLLRELSVADNVALPLCYHRNCSPTQALEEILPLLQALEMERLAEAPAGRIGRAWAQRAALARALALSPELLLLDNPLAGMDRHHVRWWRQFLPQLVAGHPVLGGRPLTLVVTTDDLRPWVAPGPRFAVVQNRHLKILGDQAQLEAHPVADLGDWLQPG